MLQAPLGRARTRAALVQFLPAELTPLALTDLFAGELDEYAELITGPAGRPVGFMTRGEGAGFTERARVALVHLGMSEHAVAHHSALAQWFEHRRGFLKIEWHQGNEGAEPLVACYYRRRPSIDATVERLADWGVPAEARELAIEVAAALDKRTVHFVSAAFRPAQSIHHKLYFSQLVTADTRDRVSARIARVCQLFGLIGEPYERWQSCHPRCVRQGESTLFVSISMSGQGVVPSFKIDYPDMPSALVAVWLPIEQREQVMADADSACALAGTRALTFLGVRFRAGHGVPSLKYYCDVPGPR